MIYLSSDTMSKYNNGYMKAASVLKKYLPETSEAAEGIRRLKAEAKGETLEQPETISAGENYLLNGFTGTKNFQWYTIRECNLMLTHRVAEAKRTPPGGCIQTGQANRPNGLPYARIYTHTKTGRNYIVKTGYR